MSRLNELTDVDDPTSKQRLKHLGNFQAMILKHALSFPSMQRVVYSTCSIHAEENERVVEEVEGWCEGRYSLVEIIPDLPSRGEGKFAKCIRMSAESDLTNGFFVACFQRTSVGNDRRSKRAVMAVVAHGGNSGHNDIGRDRKQSVSKKRRVSDVAVDTSAKKRKKKSKNRRSGKSVTAES